MLKMDLYSAYLASFSCLKKYILLNFMTISSMTNEAILHNLFVHIHSNFHTKVLSEYSI